MRTDIVYVRLSNGRYLVVRVQLVVGMGFKVTGFHNNVSIAPEVWEEDRQRASELTAIETKRIHYTTRCHEVGQLTLAHDEDVVLNTIYRFDGGSFTRQIRIV